MPSLPALQIVSHAMSCAHALHDWLVRSLTVLDTQSETVRCAQNHHSELSITQAATDSVRPDTSLAIPSGAASPRHAAAAVSAMPSKRCKRKSVSLEPAQVREDSNTALSSACWRLPCTVLSAFVCYRCGVRGVSDVPRRPQAVTTALAAHRSLASLLWTTTTSLMPLVAPQGAAAGA